jgi:hypothetical protein
VVLCDMEWVDPDLRVANGIAISDQGDMLRLDAMLMTVQLNLRKMLEVWSPTCRDAADAAHLSQAFLLGRSSALHHHGSSTRGVG